MSNQLLKQKVTYRLHTLSGLLCWMNARYEAHIYATSSSLSLSHWKLELEQGGGPDRILYLLIIYINKWMTNNKGEFVCVAPVPFNALTKLRLWLLLCGCHHFCNHSGPSLYIHMPVFI